MEQEGILITDLPPGNALRDHFLAVMRDGLTIKISTEALLKLIAKGDLPVAIQDSLDKADSALQSIAGGSIVNAMLADMAQATVKGRASGAGSGPPVDLTASQLFAILGSLVPAKPQVAAGVGQWLGWSAGAGSGYTLPTGGTWASFYISFNASNGTLYGGFTAAVMAGGSQVTPGVPSVQHTGIAWRIA